MQRSVEPTPLYVPAESPWRYRARRRQLRQLDALLLAIEEFNAREGSWKSAPAALVCRATILGCRRRRLTPTGARLHADVLKRQGELMLDVHTIHHGRLVRIVEDDARESFAPPVAGVLRKIA